MARLTRWAALTVLGAIGAGSVLGLGYVFAASLNRPRLSASPTEAVLWAPVT